MSTSQKEEIPSFTFRIDWDDLFPPGVFEAWMENIKNMDIHDTIKKAKPLKYKYSIIYK